MPRESRLLDRDGFWKRARDGDSPPPSGVGVRKQLTAEVKQADPDERVLEFTVSTGSPDRDGDVIDPEGWELENFRKNPVVLWAHSHRNLPVAKGIEVATEGNELVALAEFPEPGIHQFADTVFELLRRGFLNATSVGFNPLEWTINEERGGIDFERQELLEFSIVPVPANPEALIAASRQGVNLEPMRTWAKSTLEALEEAEDDPPEADSGASVDDVADRVELDTGTLEEKIDDLREMVESAIEAEETREAKDVITYDQAHEGGTPTAPRDREWDGQEQVAEADVDDLEVMSAWRAPLPDDRDEPVKGDYKLPHHLASGEHAVVWRAITNAAARLPQTDVPQEDVPGIQDHIAQHYEEFDETAPWDRDEEAWELYARWLGSREEAPGVEQTIQMLLSVGLSHEAAGVEEVHQRGERDEDIAFLLDLVEEDEDEEPQDPVEELLEAPEEALRAAAREAADEAATEHLRAVTGRLD